MFTKFQFSSAALGLLSLYFLFFLGACKEEAQPNLSGEAKITSFIFEQSFPQPIEGTIDEANRLITAVVPASAALGNLEPSIQISAGATVSPASGVPNDFTNGAFYRVQAENGQVANYFVQLTQASDENSITYFRFPDLFQEGNIQGDVISFNLPFGTDLSDVLVVYDPPASAAVPFLSGERVNLSEVNTIAITSAFGTTRVYTLDITYAPQETGVRGVWLTNVASDVLFSRDRIAAAMDLLQSLNFNTVFMVTWNKTTTPYPSQVLEAAIAPLNDPTIPTTFFNDGRDILQEVIEEAHARGIKVVAWFEYGFAAQFGSGNGGRNSVLQAHPSWESRDRTGGIANRNDFYWMNAFHPEVQQFMTDLVLEVVNNYDVDGVQGDDRLPAVSVSSGYDDYTVNRYREEHGGQAPPNSDQNQAWVQWRSDILTDYAESLYNAVKAADPNCLVTFSPSAYSFSFFNYCQDWPRWMQRGVVDMISPQLYRREDQGISNYRALLASNLASAFGNTQRFYPGILLRVGNYIPSDDYLVELIRSNRERGVKGEVYFFYEGVAAKERVFRAMYPGPAIFPTL